MREVRSRRIGGGCFYFRQSERQTLWSEEQMSSREGSKRNLSILPTEIFVHHQAKAKKSPAIVIAAPSGRVALL
jgi:hypothetical protein